MAISYVSQLYSPRTCSGLRLVSETCTMDPTSGYFHPFLGVELSGQIRGFGS